MFYLDRGVVSPGRGSQFSLTTAALSWYCQQVMPVHLCTRLLVTPWTEDYQAPPSMGFSRQEYWNGVPFPSLEDLPDPGIKPGSPTLQAETLPSEPPGKPTFLLRWNEKNLKNILQFFLIISKVPLFMEPRFALLCPWPVNS